jgi:hypothetical protein
VLVLRAAAFEHGQAQVAQPRRPQSRGAEIVSRLSCLAPLASHVLVASPSSNAGHIGMFHAARFEFLACCGHYMQVQPHTARAGLGATNGARPRTA